jgi:hypothetical protein
MESTLYIEPPSQKGLCRIKWSVTFNGLQQKLNTKKKCTVEEWETGNLDKKITHILDQQKTILNDIEHEADKANIPLTKTHVKAQFLLKTGQGGSKKAFFDWWDIWTKEQETKTNPKTKKKRSKKTIYQYGNTKEKLQEFEIAYQYPITILSLNRDFYEKFLSYAVVDRGYHINTHSRFIKNIITFCGWLKDKEPLLNKDWENFERHEEEGEEAEPLKPSELQEFWNVDFSDDPELEKGWLIFMCLISIGQHISDYNEGFRFNFKKGAETVHINRLKNGRPGTIPMFDDLNFRPVYVTNKLLEKYGELPHLSGDKVNDYLEYAVKILNFTRVKLTTKVGRITYCSIKKYVYKLDNKLIMKTTGHKTERQFLKYVGISKEDYLQTVKDSGHYEKKALSNE